MTPRLAFTQQKCKQDIPQKYYNWLINQINNQQTL